MHARIAIITSCEVVVWLLCRLLAEQQEGQGTCIAANAQPAHLVQQKHLTRHSYCIVVHASRSVVARLRGYCLLCAWNHGCWWRPLTACTGLPLACSSC